jgi:uncharacterized protein (TIGR00255 family)
VTSMTGFGRAERLDDEVHAVVEIKSVNNRYLDVSIALPGSLSILEPQMRELVAKHAARGRIEVYVRLRDLAGELSVSVDKLALAGYLGAMDEVRRAASLEEDATLGDLISLDGVLTVERIHDRERYWSILEPLLLEALAQFVESRHQEGARLQDDIQRQLERVAEAVRVIETNVPLIETQITENLRSRFQDVVGDSVEEPRMLAEIAIQLARLSINEEVVRLKSHLDSFRSTAGSDGPVGKKLDFLCQEVHREINTTGSKSTVLEISRQVVEAKDALENVREQLRNVE